MVQVQQLDAVGAQALEARLDRAGDVAARAAARVDVVAGRVEALGGDDELVALAADQPAEDLLGASLAVLVGGVEEIDPGLAHRAIHARAFLLVGIAAEGHRAEAKLGNLDAGTAEGAVFHAPSLP